MTFDASSLLKGVQTFVQIALAFSAMIFIHELGHFTLLKLFKVKVHEFSLGFVGKIVGFRRGGTLYKIAWIPFGGYVKPEGEFAENEDDPIPPRSLLALSWWKKALVYLAGPTMNLVGALGLFSLVLVLGVSLPLYEPVVDVPALSGAAAAGLRTGDRILSVDGSPVDSFQDLELKLSGRDKPEDKVEALELPALAHHVVADRAGSRLELNLSAEARVGALAPEGPAEKAGLLRGDLLIGVGEKKVPGEAGVLQALREQFGTEKKDSYPPVRIRVLRGGKEQKEFSLTPRWSEKEGKPLIGVVLSGGAGLEPFLPAVVGTATIGLPAREAGLKPGDKILAVEDKELRSFTDLEREVAPRGGKKTTLRVDRAGKVQDVVLEPVLFEGEGKIGISPPEPSRHRKERIPLVEVPRTAFAMTLNMALDMLNGLKMLVTGKLPVKQSLSGPLTIGRMMKQEAQAGWQDFLRLIAALNIMLGVFNLLPIPVVDGGEIFFCLLEGALGRRVRVKTYLFFKQAGFFLLVGLMIFVMWNDVAKLLKEWLRPQIL